MTVSGRDCVITLKTQYREIGLPYSEETLREAVSLLQEQAAIDGDGICRAVRKVTGVTGCVVTPLTIETAPLLIALALGRAGAPLFVSETRGLYKHELHLCPREDGPFFDVIQERGILRKRYERCRVTGFELRINRGDGSEQTGTEAVKAVMLRLDIRGDTPAATYPSADPPGTSGGERFTEEGIRYVVNGNENRDIYGFSITVKKTGGTKTEVKLHRILRPREPFPAIIENLTITAQLYRNPYEQGNRGSMKYGLFRLILSRLVLMADETAVDSTGPVIGPLRYYCAGGLSAEVFTDGNEELA
jgi:hypothetical protein